MTSGVVLLNFGEPSQPDREAVIEYLERIFLANASLEGGEQDPRERAGELARRRAPGLIEEYQAIGGSPLAEQATGQAEALANELTSRGHEVETFVGMQFSQPLIPQAVEQARAADVDRLIGLPIFPLCGPSTTVAAVDELEEAVSTLAWPVALKSVTGWHRHPTYNRLRAENVSEFATDHGLKLDADDTRLVFSAHGTPQRYLDGGSRYRDYVEEYCAAQGALLGVDRYELGFQNHANRDIPWTEPTVEQVIEDLDAPRAIVEPVSFVHEQSETLSELDRDLRADAEQAGVEFFRVPIPHGDDRLPEVLADVVEPFVVDLDPGYFNLAQCRCRDEPGTFCLNAGPRRSTSPTRGGGKGLEGQPELE